MSLPRIITLSTSYVYTKYEYLGEYVLEEPKREVVEEVDVLQSLQREVQLAARDGEAVVQSGDSLHLQDYVAGVLHLRPQTAKPKRKREMESKRERQKARERARERERTRESHSKLGHDTNRHAQQQTYPIFSLDRSIAWSANRRITASGDIVY